MKHPHIRSISEKPSLFNRCDKISHWGLTSEESALIIRGVKILHAMIGGDHLKGLKAIREAQGLSQGEVACALKIDRSTVTKWETGDAYPRGEILATLADLLHCTIDELFGRGESGGTEEQDGIC